MSAPFVQVLTEAAVETGDGVRFQGDKTHAYKHNKRSTPAAASLAFIPALKATPR